MRRPISSRRPKCRVAAAASRTVQSVCSFQLLLMKEPKGCLLHAVPSSPSSVPPVPPPSPSSLMLFACRDLLFSHVYSCTPVVPGSWILTSSISSPLGSCSPHVPYLTPPALSTPTSVAHISHPSHPSHLASIFTRSHSRFLARPLLRAFSPRPPSTPSTFCFLVPTLYQPLLPPLQPIFHISLSRVDLLLLWSRFKLSATLTAPVALLNILIIPSYPTPLHSLLASNSSPYSDRASGLLSAFLLNSLLAHAPSLMPVINSGIPRS